MARRRHVSATATAVLIRTTLAKTATCRPDTDSRAIAVVAAVNVIIQIALRRRTIGCRLERGDGSLTGIALFSWAMRLFIWEDDPRLRSLPFYGGYQRHKLTIQADCDDLVTDDDLGFDMADRQHRIVDEARVFWIENE